MLLAELTTSNSLFLLMQHNEIAHFNIRVYGLVLNEKNELLVTDEYCQSRYMTKFPGGGLEFGEGLIEGLQREFMEESGQTVEIISHFYTTDFFMKSMFRGGGQLISVYYLCRFVEPLAFPIVESAFENLPEIDDSQVFRWLPLANIQEEDLTWPIDKKVVKMLQEAMFD